MTTQPPTSTPWSRTAVGESAVLLTWQGAAAQREVAVRQLAAQLAEQRTTAVREVIPGIESVLVMYDPLNIAPEMLWRDVEPLLATPINTQPVAGTIIPIHVAYGGADGPDLASVAQACGMSEAEVVALHTAQPFPVLMLGFMPGFPYIGELPARLRLPRRTEPRTVVPAGSVAIANDQTGIYPRQSPGGWHLIGRTTTHLFDPTHDPPALLKPGDYVQFVAINTEPI